METSKTKTTRVKKYNPLLDSASRGLPKHYMDGMRYDRADLMGDTYRVYDHNGVFLDTITRVGGFVRVCLPSGPRYMSTIRGAAYELIFHAWLDELARGVA